ncbi:aldehyde dehydrogenase family protein [Mycobacterium sp. ML4]
MADALTARIVACTRELRLGPEGDVGSVIDAGQRYLVAAHVGDAVGRGARVLAGGRARDDLPGTPFEPTVLVDVPNDARILREETFGPVLPIVRVRDADEAVALANATEYGLTAWIWTRNRCDAMRLTRRVLADVVLHNDAVAVATSIETPWGGQGASGAGVHARRTRSAGDGRRVAHLRGARSPATCVLLVPVPSAQL